MKPQPGKQAFVLPIWPYISIIKGNRTMKFAKLIEFNMKNIFHEKHTKNVVQKLFSDPFLKNQN